MHNLALLLLLLNLLADLMTIQRLRAPWHLHDIFMALIELNFLLVTFTLQLRIRRLNHLLIHWAPWVLLNFPNSGVASGIVCGTFFWMVWSPATWSFLAWRRAGYAINNSCTSPVFISFNGARLRFVDTTIQITTGRQNRAADVFLLNHLVDIWVICCVVRGDMLRLFWKRWVGSVRWCCSDWVVVSCSTCLIVLLRLFASLIALTTLRLGILPVV